MSTAWYIDAWAVRDGVAFASHRPSGSIDATNTVFMSVPSLEPIPVGRISTALRATRGPFQAGFRDDDGDEIAFENLAQVREVVRRAYLASGIGLDGTAGAVVVAPRPEPGAGGGMYYEHIVEPPSPGEMTWYSAFFGPAASLRALESDRAGLVELVAGFGEATLVEWELALAAVDLEAAPRREVQRFQRGLYEWYGRLIAIDAWESSHALRAFTADNPCPFGQKLVDRFGYDYLALASWHDRHYSDQELLAMAPCPLRAIWSPDLTHLSDKLFLALSAADYLPGNPRLAELAAVLLTVAVGLPEADYVHPGGDRVAQLDARIGDALGWLAHEVPSVELPAVANALLDRYAWTRLDVDSGPEKPPPVPQPAPEPKPWGGAREEDPPWKRVTDEPEQRPYRRLPGYRFRPVHRQEWGDRPPDPPPLPAGGP